MTIYNYSVSHLFMSVFYYGIRILSYITIPLKLIVLIYM